MCVAIKNYGDKCRQIKNSSLLERKKFPTNASKVLSEFIPTLKETLNMAGRAGSIFQTNPETLEEFLVVKPSNNSSREIRDAILKQYFSFTDLDIAEFNREHEKSFIVFDLKTAESSRAKKIPIPWATPAEVKSWAVNGKNEVSIGLPIKLIEFLMSYRTQRIEFEAFRVASFVKDSAIKQSFENDLLLILGNTGEKRATAFQNLMNTIGGAGRSRGEIYLALRFLMNESGYKDNPYLILAFAATSSNYPDNFSSIGSNSINTAKITDALKIANERFYSPSSPKSALNRIDKYEATVINSWASILYRRANDDASANHSEWISRYLKMSAEEKELYEEGDLISIIPPNENQFRGLSQAERDFGKNEKDFDQRLQEWERQDRIGQPNLPPTDHRTSELFQTNEGTIQEQVLEKNKANTRHSNRNKPRKPGLRQVLRDTKFNYYQDANKVADAYGAVFTIFIEAAKWNKFNDRMDAITIYLNKKEQLETRIFGERHRLKPPRPEVTLQHIKEFKKYGRITSDSRQRLRIYTTLTQLNILLEEGRAYYK